MCYLAYSTGMCYLITRVVTVIMVVDVVGVVTVIMVMVMAMVMMVCDAVMMVCDGGGGGDYGTLPFDHPLLSCCSCCYIDSTAAGLRAVRRGWLRYRPRNRRVRVLLLFLRPRVWPGQPHTPPLPRENDRYLRR